MVRRRTRPDQGRFKILSFIHSFVIDLVIELVLLAFLLFWKPRYESLEDARRASRPLQTTGRPPHRNRSHRRLARALTAVCVGSSILILLSIYASPMITAWHHGGWIQ